MNLPGLIKKVADGEELSQPDIEIACALLLDGASPVEDRAAFLSALHRRGETPAEIAHFVEVLLGHAVQLPFSGKSRLDVCGTGGDRAGFFNISTAVMFVAAGAGASVVKHGNRGITSKSGGADVLEALGICLGAPQEQVVAALGQAGLTFLFAPGWHPALVGLAPLRRSLGIRTVFNLIGPLVNPLQPDAQVLGVARPDLLDPMAEALRRLEEGVGDEAPEEAEDEPNREPDYLTVHVEAEPGPLVLRRIVYRGAPDLLEFTLPSGSVYEFPFREALALLRPVVG